MSTIRPFAAIRFVTRATARDISTRLSPPYDILEQRDKDALLAADTRNFVKIDLPHTPPKSAGPPEAYAAAQATLAAWLADGTLVRDTVPAVYVYHQRFRHDGGEHTRRMFFVRLGLEAFGTGSVFPHETTFGGPKEDRLCLTKATGANLSPIFGLYEDAEHVVSRHLEAALPREPLAVGTLDGVENLLWGVSDVEVVSAVARLMATKPIYIADGHHRYGTGLLYRDWLVEQRGSLPADHPANFVLCALCAMEDPGLLILPTHRVLPGVNVTEEALRADQRLDVGPLNDPNPAEAVHALNRLGPQAVVVFNHRSGKYLYVRPRDADVLNAFEPQRSPAWRRLGLAFLHAYLLDRLVTPSVCGGAEPTIHYIKSAPDAIAAATQSAGTAFLMQPTTMAELRSVCSAGDLMPQKSTYFYPKLASGLVINPLTD